MSTIELPRLVVLTKRRSVFPCTFCSRVAALLGVSSALSEA